MSAKLTVTAYLERVTVTTGECWLVSTRRPRGYAERGKKQAHVWVYEQIIGPVPDGLQLDHLCHTWDLTCPGGNSCPHRACVNPRHLEPVTAAENRRRTLIRVTHCPSGHPYRGDNLIVWTAGGRRCRICKQTQSLARDRARGVKPQRVVENETHCVNGHAYVGDNLIYTTSGRSRTPRRTCRTCRRAAQRAYKQRRRAS